MDDPFIGQTINNKFHIVAPIGAGGMGKIYRASQVPLGRTVALKVLRNTQSIAKHDPQFQKRFFLEASLCAKFSHPNIVTVYDYGRIESGVKDLEGVEAYFLAMEYLQGESLLERLRRRDGLLPAADTLAITLEVARGLREAHRQGVVHRDLKPGNIMLVPDEESGERVKIVDFGLVKQVVDEDREDLTQEGSFLGSPKYMAPEQIEHSNIDARTDLYALGVIMYQCLTGHAPFEAASSMQVLLAHLSNPVPSFKDRNPLVEIPQLIEVLVRKLLEKRPEARVQSAEELVREIRAIQDALGYASRGGSSGVFRNTGQLPVVTGPADHTQTSLSQSTTRNVLGAGVPSPVTGNTDPSGSLSGTALSSDRPSQPSKNRSPWLFVGIGVLIAGGAAGGAIALRSKPPADRAAGSSTTAPPASTTTTTSQPGTTGNNTTIEHSYVLTIHSTPEGAEVMENGASLGKTPATITFDPAQKDTRHFVVSHAGYSTLTVNQSPLTANRELMLPLVPESTGTTVVQTPPPPQPASEDAGSANTASSQDGNTDEGPTTNSRPGVRRTGARPNPRTTTPRTNTTTEPQHTGPVDTLVTTTR